MIRLSLSPFIFRRIGGLLLVNGSKFLYGKRGLRAGVVCELQILWIVEVLEELLSCVKEALINVLFEFVVF